MAEVESPWMTAAQVREYLGGVHEATLNRYRYQGLPVHYIGEGKTSPRYHKDEVDAWILSRSKGSTRQAR